MGTPASGELLEFLWEPTPILKKYDIVVNAEIKLTRLSIVHLSVLCSLGQFRAKTTTTTLFLYQYGLAYIIT